MKTIEQIQQELAEPFPPSKISWRPGPVRGEDGDRAQCLAFAYVTAGAVMDRLDAVVGIGNWSDSYQAAPNPEKASDPAVMCTLSIRIDGEWVSKSDVAENTDVEGVKGGFSDSFKRAGVKWGIGRYLKRMDPQWVAATKRGKSWVIAPDANPKIPREFLPGATPMQEPQPKSALADAVERMTEPRRDLDESTGELRPQPKGGGDAGREGRAHANGQRSEDADAWTSPRPATSPAPVEPRREPTPINGARELATSTKAEWQTLCKLMPAKGIGSAVVAKALGGKFDQATFEAWLGAGTGRNAVTLIDDIEADLKRAASH